MEKPPIDLDFVACEAWRVLRKALGGYTGRGTPIGEHQHYNCAIDASLSVERLVNAVQGGAIAMASRILAAPVLRWRELAIPYGVEAVRFTADGGCSLRVVLSYGAPYVSEDELIVVPEMWVVRLDVGILR